MADNNLLWQVELLPPNQKNVQQVKDAIDGVTRSQKAQTAAKQQAAQTQRQEVSQAKKFKTALAEIRVEMQKTEEATRFGNATKEEAISNIEKQRLAVMNLRDQIENSNISRSEQLKLIQQANARMKQSHLATSRVETGFHSMSSSVGSANAALVETGRVVSDMPFGFVAISNNIEVAMIQFSRLRERTGSAGAALNAMKSQLLGTSGLIVLFASVVPAAISFSMMGMRNWGGSAATASKKQDQLEESTRDLINAFEDLHTVQGTDPLGLQKVEGHIRSLESVRNNLQEVLDIQEKIDTVSDDAFREMGELELMDLMAQQNKLLEVVGLTRKEYKSINKEFDSLIEKQKALEQRSGVTPEMRFRVENLKEINRLIDLQELGIERQIGSQMSLEDQLRSTKHELESYAKEFRNTYEEGDESVIPYLKAVKEQIEAIDDALDDADLDLNEKLLGDDPKDFTISDEIIEDFSNLDSKMKQLEDEQKRRRKERTKFIKGTIKDEFKVRMDMLDDGTQAEIQAIKMIEDIERQARRHGLEDHKTVESLKSAITQRAARSRMEMELKREKELTDAKIGLVSEVANFTSAMNQAIGEDSKVLALLELGIQKALKIGQVSTDANRRVFELNAMAAQAQAEAGVAAASGNFVQASSLSAAAVAAKTQAAKVKGMAAKTIAVIAATGLMEGIGTLTDSGGSGSSGARGTGRKSGRGLGFQMDDEEDAPRRRSSFLPDSLQGREEPATQVFVVENNFDEDGIATLVRRGDRSRFNRARTFKSIDKE